MLNQVRQKTHEARSVSESIALVHPAHALRLSGMHAEDFHADSMFERATTPAPAKSFPFANGIAVISISGMLAHRYNGSYSSVTGYDAIRRQLTDAVADADVKQIVFDANSPGGHVAGAFELSDFIYAQRGKKKMTAIVDAAGYSACYALISAADKIVVTPTGGVGSIGVVTTHIDVSGALEKYGEVVTMIYAGDRKIDGSPYQKLSASARAAMQARVDGYYNDFVALVARNRGIDESKVRATEAACYSAKDAITVGLADAVLTSQDAMAAIVTELSSSNNQEEYVMTGTTQPAAAAAPVTTPAAAPVAAPAAEVQVVKQPDAAVAERERISAITTCEEAKGKESLAQHFAFKTGMSVEDAKAALVAASAAVVTPAAAPAANAFTAAMASGNPEVGAEGGVSADNTNVDHAKLILADYSKATGFKPATH